MVQYKEGLSQPLGMLCSWDGPVEVPDLGGSGLYVPALAEYRLPLERSVTLEVVPPATSS